MLSQAILPVTVKEKKSLITTFLGVCILLMSLATIFSIFGMGGSNPAKAATTPVIQKVVPAKTYADSKEMYSWISKTNNQLFDLERKLDAWAERTWLLQVALNENTMLNRCVESRQGIPDPGYIVFDRNSKMNRMPKTMSMTPDQKAKIQKNLR